MSSDIFDQFKWHSSTGINADAVKSKKMVWSISAKDAKRIGQFVTAGNDLLIHKSTKALWKFSDDGGAIVPVFEEDVLTEDELK